MPNPDIDPPIETPAYVKRHPDLAALLKGRAGDRSRDTPQVTELRAHIRSRIRQQLDAARTPQAQAARAAAGRVWLARYRAQ